MRPLLQDPASETNQRKVASLMRGFFSMGLSESIWLYEKGAVQEYSNEGAVCRGTVLEDRSYEVALNVDVLPFSRCSCLASGSCSHMGAVLLAWLADMGMDLPVFLKAQKLGGLKTAGITTKSAREEEPAGSGKSQGSASAAKAKATPASSTDSKKHLSGLLSAHANYREWHEGFQQLQPDFRDSARTSLHFFDEIVLEQLFAPAEGWVDKQRQGLYRLHALVYAMHLADLTAVQYRGPIISELKDRWNAAFSTRLVEVSKPLKLPDLHLNPVYEGAVRGLAERLRAYAWKSYIPSSDWFTVHWYLWGQGILPLDMRDKEISALTELAEKAPTPKMQSYGMAFASTLVQFTAGDQAAVDYIKSRTPVKLPIPYILYMQRYSALKQWPQLKLWLEGVAPYMLELPELQSMYLECWRKLAESTRDWTSYEKALVDLLPAAAKPYSDYLLKRTKYAEWVDFMIMDEESLWDKGLEQELAMVEKKAPHLLLPLYHHYVYFWIAEKNRSGYENAVWALRNLKALYVKLKRESDWKSYMTRLESQHSRLSSLLKLLKEAKLIS